MRLAGPVDLDATLLGGQAFRWRAASSAYEGVVDGRVLRLAPLPGGRVEASAQPRIRRRILEAYLGLDAAHARAHRALAKDPVIAPLLARDPGLRILRQDPWEALAAFITSANNNVARISLAMDRLARTAGRPFEADLGEGPRTWHAFPGPSAVARLDEGALRACGLGYRAPLLRSAARAVARGRPTLERLRDLSLEEAREALVALPGVGPKVADCVLLFGLGHDDAFPVDRWIARAVRERLPEAPEAPRELAVFARERWGRAAGLAQQHLFHRARAEAPRRATRPGALAGS